MAVAHTLEINHLVVQRRLVSCSDAHKGNDSAGIVKLVLLLKAFVIDGDEQALVQKCKFTQALRKRVEAEVRGFKNLRIRLERDFRSAAIGMSGGATGIP